MAKTEATDTRAMFDALGPAFDEVKAKTDDRDKAAAKLDAANKALAASTEALSALQDQISAIIGRSPDPTRIR